MLSEKQKQVAWAAYVNGGALAMPSVYAAVEAVLALESTPEPAAHIAALEKLEAADLHVENVRLKAQLAALTWHRITEQDLPKVGQVVAGFDAGRIVLIGVIHAAYGPIKESQCLLAQGYTHFCSIAPPADKAGA